MTRTPYVPDVLRGMPFRGTDAVDRGLLTKRQLASSAWTRVARDLYVTREDADDPQVRLACLRLITAGDPSAVVCGRTAAWLLGAWDPGPGHAVPLEVTRPVRAPGTVVSGMSRRRLTLRGTSDWRAPLSGVSELDDDIIELDGLRTTSPLRTCFDLLRNRPLVEAVVVADAFAYRTGMPLPLLEAYVQARPGWPGIVVARQAVSLASASARSPGETRTRMVVVLSGFEEPLVNVPMLHPVSRRVLAVPDLGVFTRAGRLVAVEYDGAYHDTEDQAHLDRVRHNDITVSADWPTLRYDRYDLRDKRPRMVKDLERMTGYKAVWPLEDADFAFPPARLAM